MIPGFRFHSLIRLSRLWRNSIQRWLALAFGGIALLMMSGLTGLLLEQQHDFLNNASIRRANAVANGLARSSISWVLANDLVGLNEVLDGYRDLPNLQRAFVLSLHGEVLASTRSEEIGLFVTDEISQKMLTGNSAPQVLIANDNLIDVAAPILLGQRLLGWVRIGLDQEATHANLKAVAITSLAFIVITALIVLIVAILLAKGVTRRLKQLVQMASTIASGARNVRAPGLGNDEISILGRSLNTMIDTIADSERQLNRLNRVYAAWTESVAAIVRENDEQTLLTRICEILVKKIDLQLAFVGLVESSGWIKPEASSNSNSAYLKQLRLSIDADLPEGKGPVGKSIRMQAPYIVNDFINDADIEHWHHAAKLEAIKSAAAFPLRRNDQIIGALAVYSKDIDYFSNDIVHLLDGLANDISFALDNFEHERQRLQAESELTLAASVFDNSQEGILITDADQKILRVNGTFTLLTGYKPEEVLGHTPHILASGRHDKKFYQDMWKHIFREGYWQGEIINRKKDGNIYPEWLTIIQVKDKKNQVTHYVGNFIDITDQKFNEERIQKLAFYDPLTQLPNRRLLIDRLDLALLESQRSQHYGALMFLDLDRFKILNDTHGHALGDQLLVSAGERISLCVREQDTVARIGGDEFVVVLREIAEDSVTAIRVAQRICHKILNALTQPYELGHLDEQGNSIPILYHSSTSIGLALFQGAKTSSEELLKQADIAMYHAKHAGRNALRIFDPEMQSRLNQRAILELDMREALLNNHFRLHYQVQVDRQGRAVGAEVLLRWEHPLRGLIFPGEFIPLAEESGLIIALGQWVLLESCKTLNAWAKRSATRHLTLAVNVSAKQFNQVNFIEELKSIIDKTCINPGLLKLEITESIILEDIEQTIDKMNILRELGLSFSMDDFGTGYSSLSYLQRLPLAQIKIDQSFIRNLANNGNDNDAAIIRTILTLGKTLRINVVAEGVETQAQRNYLANNGCQYFQGYLFGKPEPLLRFEQRLAINPA